MHTIGFFDHDIFRGEASHLAEFLESKSISTKLVPLEYNGPFDFFEHEHASRIEKALNDNQIDIGLQYLTWIPPGKKGPFTIGALIARRSPADCLIIRSGVKNNAVPIPIDPSARIGIAETRREALLQDLRPDLSTEKIDRSLEIRLDLLQKEKIDAIFCPAHEGPRILSNFPGATSFTFDPREFIPYPAAGVIACQYRQGEDEIRKILASVHDRDLGHCSNVERQILVDIDARKGIAAAYCRVDDYSHFHVSAVFSPSLEATLQYARVSASTYKGMPEAVLAQFDLSKQG